MADEAPNFSGEKQLAFLGSWVFVVGLISLGLQIWDERGLSFDHGGPIMAIALGFSFLEGTRRRMQAGPEASSRPFWRHLGVTLPFTIPVAVLTLWLMSFIL